MIPNLAELILENSSQIVIMGKACVQDWWWDDTLQMNLTKGTSWKNIIILPNPQSVLHFLVCVCVCMWVCYFLIYQIFGLARFYIFTFTLALCWYRYSNCILLCMKRKQIVLHDLYNILLYGPVCCLLPKITCCTAQRIHINSCCLWAVCFMCSLILKTVSLSAGNKH